MNTVAPWSAIVTGGASGLGLATAKRLASRGASVVLADLGSSNGTEASAVVGTGAVFVPSDITKPDGLNDAVTAASERGPVRALVHCAGRGSDRLRILDRDGQPASLDSFVDVVTINLVGTYNALRAGAAAIAASAPVEGERGAIVLTASVAAFDGQVGQTSYTASKAGVAGMTLVAARDLASWGIRVNTIAPGVFETPMLARLRGDLRDKLAESVPFPKRLGDPDEYAALAVLMLENRYLNGETVRLDGSIRMAPK